MDGDNKDGNSISQILKGNIVTVILGLLTTIISGLLIWLKTNFVDWISKPENYGNPDVYKLILAFLNLVVVALFFGYSQNLSNLEFKKKSPDEERDPEELYWDLLNVEVKDNHVEVQGEAEPVEQKEQAENNEERVNKLVDQLHENIKFFAFFLVLVYSLFMIDNQSLFAWFGLTNDLYNSLHPWFKLGEDISNFISAVFIFLAFLVLYDKTLTPKNKVTDYRSRPALFALAFVSIYVLFFAIFNPPRVSYEIASLKQIKETVQKEKDPDKAIEAIKNMEYQYGSGSNGTPHLAEIKNIAANGCPSEPTKSTFDPNCSVWQKITLINNKVENYLKPGWLKAENLFQLFIGMFNGLAMALLFGRYISMEHVMEPINRIRRKHKKLFSRATIYLLPVYALTQPLFGSFEIDAFGDPKWLQNGVFLFCLVGKAFFLYFTWWFMKDRLLHLFLHIVLTKYGVPKDFRSLFRA